MALVQTIKGLIERSELEVNDFVEETEGYRTIVTEWRHQGEIVKRDAHVAILIGESISGKQQGV